MKLCAACHQDLPKDKFSKKQWKLGAECQRRCTSCVRDNREVQLAPQLNNNNQSANNDGFVNSLESMSINDNDMQTISDEDLFKLPPLEDCPICFLRMPSLYSGQKYKTCCGKMICSGCIIANAKMDLDKQLCPFCRTPNSISNKEMTDRLKNRVKMNDAIAMFNVGCHYADGLYCPQNRVKAIELWQRAGDLGCSRSYYNIGNAYLDGRGVQRDMKKAVRYWELAAMGGNTVARANLGIFEENEGDMERALKHYMIAVGSGCNVSLDTIKELFTEGHATKEDYGTALQSYQSYLDEIRSDQRDEAAALDDELSTKYY